MAALGRFRPVELAYYVAERKDFGTATTGGSRPKPDGQIVFDSRAFVSLSQRIILPTGTESLGILPRQVTIFHRLSTGTSTSRILKCERLKDASTSNAGRSGGWTVTTAEKLLNGPCGDG